MSMNIVVPAVLIFVFSACCVAAFYETELLTWWYTRKGNKEPISNACAVLLQLLEKPDEWACTTIHMRYVVKHKTLQLLIKTTDENMLEVNGSAIFKRSPSNNS